ncbi:nuclear factor NF-kappa-B p110 subunit-like isoform X2 [Condylostylus longicornis]|uniref:nuclear factor NF-kappa-B p110 subunit-like isoform X2 n=1 Tax=Condylostylus longicornis TaxID=2530218 RepID=UPI00244E5733|nr:nuclear factor NF-kappa-B p110 subunit-like isoform X2 [Condylostylus longicornis]
MAKRIHKIDSGYSSTSPGSYSSASSMSPSQSSQDAPYQDFQSLQLTSVVNNFGDIDHGIDIKYEFVNQQISTQFEQQYQYLNFQNTNCNTINPLNEVQLEIVEQPVSKFRYRYISEMNGTHGSLMGINSSKGNKTFPTVELKGFNGDALIRCSLYQIDKKQPHSHRLVVRKNDLDVSDPHELRLNKTVGYRAVFQGMGIIHTAKRDIADELYRKKKKWAEFEKGCELTLKENTKFKSDSEKEAKLMNLNQVVLRFEAYEINKDKLLRQLCAPVYSTPISNMKCALTGELKITRISTCVSSAAGGDDVFLFVEKVGKKNIKVKFFEMENDEIVWYDYGSFLEADVHHQYAIALRTPAYKDKDIEKYVQVYIQLERPSDGDTSEPIEFKYKPRDCVSSRKRARTCSSGIGSHELPATIHNNTINCNMNGAGNNKGPTISEEFNKNAILENLKSYISSRETEFLEQVKNNSDELLNIVDPSIFDPFDENDNLETDCHGLDLSLHQRRTNSSLTKQMLFRINNILRISKRDGIEAGKIRENIETLLLECYENDKDLLHTIIRNKEIKEGIFLMRILDKFKLYDIVNLKNDDGDNCLHVACTFDRSMFIRSLINLGANVNTQNHKGKTPLHIAVEEQFENSIIKILDENSYCTRSEKLNIDLANDDGYTALHVAVKKGNLNIVKKLIEVGKASTKICCSKNGNNVLHLAVEENNPEIVKYLLDFTNVRIHEKNTSGCTALSIAQSMGEKGKCLVDAILQRTETITNKLYENVKSEKSDSSSGESDDDRSIRSLKIVEDSDMAFDEKKNITLVDHLDDSTIEKISTLLIKNEKWIKLAELLNLHSSICHWNSPKAMFNFINESKDINVTDVIDALYLMNEDEVISHIKTDV